MKILILGHNGLLGNMVYKYFYLKNYDIITTNLRWPTDEFKLFIENQNINYIINCIGIIPQRCLNDELYNLINYELPVWLDNLNVKIIHPDTDEENSLYGKSKIKARENINKNTKIIRTSIIGIEKNTNYSFLNWFLNSKNSINGFTNWYWNGNTTLEWAKWSEKIILNWNEYNKITILESPECLSKYEIMINLKKIFNKNINIKPVESLEIKNNCLKGDFITKNIFEQIEEMKNFLKKIK